MKHVALIGECMAEFSGQPFKNVQVNFGGDSLNSALYLSRLSRDKHRVSYVTALGGDPLSRAMLEAWNEEGIDTSQVLYYPNKEVGVYCIETDDDGERRFFYWRENSAARDLVAHPDFSRVEHALKNSDYVYFSGISAAILKQQEQFILLLEELSKESTSIIYDSNYRPRLWESESAAKRIYESTMGLTNVALVTYEDEQALWGDSSIASTISRIHSFGVPTVVVKLGSDGCVLSEKTNNDSAQIAITPEREIKPIDTTSAGDAFNAGFIFQLCEGQSHEYACKFANRVAGHVIQFPGAIVPQQDWINF